MATAVRDVGIAAMAGPSVAIWIDGALIADWQNVRLRDSTALMIDQVSLGLYIGTNPNRQNVKWYDDVVIATSYIGPMSSGGSTSAGTTSGGAASAGQTGGGSTSGVPSGGHRGCGSGGSIAAAALTAGLVAALVGLRRRA